MSTQTIQRPTIPAGSWTIDPVHSSARFEVRHSGISTFRGGFGDIEARLEGGDEPSLEGVVKVDSVDISEAQLKGHLLSPDFFDAERTPDIRFSSRELRVGEDGALELRGELEIAGTTREVEAHGRIAHVPADLAGGERIGLSLETAIDRTDYGIDWQMELPSGGDVLAWDVTLDIHLELTQAGEDA